MGQILQPPGRHGRSSWLQPSAIPTTMVILRTNQIPLPLSFQINKSLRRFVFIRISSIRESIPQCHRPGQAEVRTRVLLPVLTRGCSDHGPAVPREQFARGWIGSGRGRTQPGHCDTGCSILRGILTAVSNICLLPQVVFFLSQSKKKPKKKGGCKSSETVPKRREGDLQEGKDREASVLQTSLATC